MKTETTNTSAMADRDRRVLEAFRALRIAVDDFERLLGQWLQKRSERS